MRLCVFHKDKWKNLCKNVSSKICGRQPLKYLYGSSKVCGKPLKDLK